MSLVPKAALDELDRNPPPSVDEWDAELRALVERFHDPENGIMIGLGPTGPTRCSDDLMMKTREIADELDLQIHTHTLETKMQRASGPDMYGTTIVRHLRDIGFLSPRTHLTHGVWLDETEIDLMAESGATVVHNPISNLKLGSGIAPVPEMTRKRVGVSLGTDGICAGDGQNMYEAVKLAAIVHKVNGEPYEDWFGAADAWDLATRQGARALGAEVGVIEPGSSADLCLLSIEHGAFTPMNDPILHLALQIPTGAIEHLMVNGNWVLRDSTLTGVDEAELLAEAREIGPGLVDSHQKAFAFGDALLPSISTGWHTVNSTPNENFDSDV
jgi:5-methylthioadenosine/S-adenosylhomocysteine deaminase